MGAWDVGSFDNDDAADWAYGLEATKDLSLVERTLDQALASAYLNAYAAAEVVAAIEVIARLQGHWGERSAYSEAVDSWVEANPMLPPGALVAKAHQVLDRILGADSELNALWQESDEHAAWLAAIGDLKSRVHGTDVVAQAQ
jgi:hypothetical protein